MWENAGKGRCAYRSCHSIFVRFALPPAIVIDKLMIWTSKGLLSLSASWRIYDVGAGAGAHIYEAPSDICKVLAVRE